MNDKSEPKVTIRRAVAEDLNEVVDLCAAHSAYEHATFDPAGHLERLAIAIAAPDPRVVIYIAVSEGMSVGYASVSREFSTWAAREYIHMDCLFVLEAMRGRRIGRLLFDAVVDEAHRLGIANIEWQTPDWNSDAIGFYRSFGAIDNAKARFTYNISPTGQLP